MDSSDPLLSSLCFSERCYEPNKNIELFCGDESSSSDSGESKYSNDDEYGSFVSCSVSCSVVLEEERKEI